MAYISPVPSDIALQSMGLRVSRTESGGCELVLQNCPICGKKDHFVVNKDSGLCFCRRCRWKGTLVTLWGEITGNKVEDRESFKKAINALKSASGGLEDYSPLPPRAEDTCALADIETRDKVYRAFLEELDLKETHLVLLKKRGLTEEEIDRLHYRSVPQGKEECRAVTSRVIKRCGFEPKGVPGFFLNGDGFWTCVSTQDGFFIPALDIHCQVQGLQIRITNPRRKKNGKAANKYRWFSSRSIRGSKYGTGAKGFLHYSSRWIRKKDGVMVPIIRSNQTVCLTEGHLKGDIARMAVEGRMVFLCVPGVDQYNLLKKELEKLKALGVTRIVSMLDMDEFPQYTIREAQAILTHHTRVALEMFDGVDGEKLHRFVKAWCDRNGGNEAVAEASKVIEALVRAEGFAYERRKWAKEYKGIDDFAMAVKRGI